MEKIKNFINLGNKERLSKILNDKEKMVITLRFGIPDDDSLTLQQIADLMGLTRERVRQIEKQALEKLRNNPHMRKFKDLVD